MKPENAKQLPTNCDLTYAALEGASEFLPASKIYRVVVHPLSLREANKLCGIHANVILSNPLSPGIEIISDELITNRDEWRLEVGNEVIWSPGA